MYRLSTISKGLWDLIKQHLSLACNIDQGLRESEMTYAHLESDIGQWNLDNINQSLCFRQVMLANHM